MYSLKKVFQRLLEKIGNASMGTSATTITGAIAEHETDISNLNSNLNYVQTDWIGYEIGTTNTRISGIKIRIPAIKLSILHFNNLATGTTLSPGTEYNMGSTGNPPTYTVFSQINRKDSGNGVCTILITSSGNIVLRPLVTVPSGVNMCGTLIWVYQ